VRGARDAFRYLLSWLACNHPEITSLTGLTRDHIEAYLTHLHDRINPRNGRPLVARTRYGYISPLLIFFQEASQWGWDDVPSRPLLGRSDLPKLPARLPRFIPRDELDRLMKAIEGLPAHCAAAGALERRPKGRSPQAHHRLPGHLP
jgi:site-specific recombinase XerD